MLANNATVVYISKLIESSERVSRSAWISCEHRILAKNVREVCFTTVQYLERDASEFERNNTHCC